MNPIDRLVYYKVKDYFSELSSSDLLSQTELSSFDEEVIVQKILKKCKSEYQNQLKIHIQQNKEIPNTNSHDLEKRIRKIIKILSYGHYNLTQFVQKKTS